MLSTLDKGRDPVDHRDMDGMRVSKNRQTPGLDAVHVRRLSILVAVMSTVGCMQTGYVVQAGLGQLALIGNARPVDEVLADSSTDARTRLLLSEVAPVLRFARDNGLSSKGNYRKFVDLDRSAVVWFMATSKELSFEPKVWNFPIVGSFTYLGWFDYHEAQQVKRRLQAKGWDVHVRGASAYSTGGWFNDPVLSTMFSPHDDALRTLVNVLLHELTHANILIRDQSTFNESIASFMGDTLAEQYLTQRFGAESHELVAFRTEQAESRLRGKTLAKAYRQLQDLYDSKRSDDDKRAEKKRILDKLELDLELRYRPNNASLIGFKTYNAGLAELESLYQACDRDWRRFIAQIRTLKPSSFGESQAEDIGPTIAKLAAKKCPK